MAEKMEEISFPPLDEEFENLVAPLGSDGYIQSFDIEQTEELLEFYNTYGFVVIKDVIDDVQIEKSIDEIWATDYLLGKPNLKRDDPSTWEDVNWPTEMGLGQGGFLTHYTDVGLPESWNNRQNPKIHKLFSLILQREDLWVKFDRYGMMRPTTNIKFNDNTFRDRFDWKTRERWLHWDLNPWQYKNTTVAKLQGLLSLSNSTETTGGFHCVPGFHRNIVAWAERNLKLQRRGTLIEVPPTDNIRNAIQKITIKKGNFLLWNSALPHANYPNCSSEFRVVQYITMFPAEEEVEKQAVDRVDAVYMRTREPPHPELTELGEKLLGRRRWRDGKIVQHSFVEK